MKKAWGCLLSALVAAASTALAQEATERYVPIGQSPGMSGKTSIGIVQAVNTQARSITVATSGNSASMKWSERTRIWIDRSRQQLSALRGGTNDIQVGRRVEVKPDKNDRNLAEWIKVEPIAVPN